jgi:hypothetical protein
MPPIRFEWPQRNNVVAMFEITCVGLRRRGEGFRRHQSQQAAPSDLGLVVAVGLLPVVRRRRSL